MTETRRPLLSPDLRLLLVSMVLANIGSFMITPLLALYVASLGASVSQVGFVLHALFDLPAALPNPRRMDLGHRRPDPGHLVRKPERPGGFRFPASGAHFLVAPDIRVLGLHRALAGRAEFQRLHG